MRNKLLKIAFFSFPGIFVFLFIPHLAMGALVTDVRFWSAPDHSRVVIDLTDSVQYESSSQESPPQFHLELKGAFLYTPKREVEVNDPFLARISVTGLEKGRVKLTLHQKKALNVNAFILKPYEEKTYRLVIDLVDVMQEKKEVEERRRQKETMPSGTKIVVIDPGHGGDDPGAVGPGKTMEKDVVLKVGEKVVQFLNQSKEIKSFLTRKGDYFIKLEDRKKIAEEYKADLFVSLHADASFNPQARGSSVYCLSTSGATDEAARILADKENLSNVLGGATSRPMTSGKDDLEPILVDLTLNNTMRESFLFAETLLKDIKAVNSLKYTSFRQASFIVLKSLKYPIPSVLLETAYITNKEDERLLNRSEFQEKMAKAIQTSIKTYFGP